MKKTILVVHAPRHPLPGETLLGHWFATFPGGKGANQAVAAGRLGGQVVMVDRVGRDTFGPALLSELRASAVDASLVAVDENTPTGVALITVNDQGQNSIVVVPGANGCLSPDDVNQAEPVFARSSVLLAQLECPIPAVEAAVRLAYKHGVRVLLNPAPAAPLTRELVAMVDYLTPNQHELAVLTGVSELEQGVQILRDWGAKNVIVTLGGNGVYYSGMEGSFFCPAIPVKVVDTTAAGDAFTGGFGMALAEGAPLKTAIRWGIAAGALAVTRTGAQSSLPSRAEVEALLLQQGSS